MSWFLSSFSGPNSIAKCNIEPERDGRYIVTYTPVEVGVYAIRIKWNGRDIEGEFMWSSIVQ